MTVPTRFRNQNKLLNATKKVTILPPSLLPCTGCSNVGYRVIHRRNHYPTDTCLGNQLGYLMDRDVQRNLHKNPATKNLAPVVQMLNSATIQWLSIRESDCTMHWIEIYPVDSAIHLLDNWGLDFNI